MPTLAPRLTVAVFVMFADAQTVIDYAAMLADCSATSGARNTKKVHALAWMSPRMYAIHALILTEG